MVKSANDRFFEAVDGAADALLGLLESGNRRSYRLSRVLIRQARRGGREMVELGRDWTAAPIDVSRCYEVQLDLQTRVLEAVRECGDELEGAPADVTGAVGRLLRANGAAAQALFQGFTGAPRRIVSARRPAPIARARRRRARRPARAGGTAEAAAV